MIIGAVGVSADFFNEGGVPVLLKSVRCVGNETALLDCPSVEGSGFSCPTIGVSCQGKH